MLRMQEMTFPGFKNFLGEYSPRRPPPFMCGILATHVAFSHCYPPLIYYLTERSLFKKCPPTGKSLKKALETVAKKYIRFHYTFSHDGLWLKSISDFIILLATTVCG
jgi:hypothetical protein